MTPLVRALEPRDWAELRAVRLEALTSEPGVFHSSLDAEAPLEAHDWEALLGAADKRVFGLFLGSRLIGITGVFTHRDDPTGRTAALGFSYIAPEHRGRGWSALLYQARLAWIASQPQFQRAVVSHRAGNEPSARAIRGHGFVLISRATRRWPDGTDADELVYELPVSALAAARFPGVRSGGRE